MKPILLLLLLASPLLAEPLSIAPDDPRILLMGRADLSDPKAPAFDWPAVNIRVAVKGPDLTFLLEDGGTNYFNLSLDGKQVLVVAAKKGLNRIKVPGLGEGRHQVILSKRTEGFQGPAVFRGLELGANTSLQAAPTLPSRKIEFVGDSWSCGYGNEGVTYGHCDNLTAVSNADLAFPVVLARLLDAQYHVTAVSGRGILRNYGDAKTASDDNMPKDFERTLFSKPGSKWDPAQWVPDAVVLRLGVNDHSTSPAPTEADFVRAYSAFLERLRACCPKAEIFCFADEGWPDYKPRVLKAIAEREKKGDKRLHWVGNRGFSPSELGCDWHPSVKAHQELAELLEKEIRPVLGWNDKASQTGAFSGTEEPARFVNREAGVTLAGTLVLPPGKGPFPAAIFLCGGGPGGRNPGLISFAETLAQRGIAVLLYDKRGIGESTGDFKSSHYPEFQKDAIAAFEFLKQHPKIDPNKVGLMGHSEGGMLTEMIAAERQDAAFAVLFAAPGLRGDKLRALQGIQESKAYGVDEKVSAKVKRIMEEGLPMLATEKDPQVARQKLHGILTEGYEGLNDVEKKQLRDVLEADNDTLEEGAVAPSYQRFLNWDPVPFLKKIQCPVLALNGDKDIAVVQPQNFEAIEKALKEGGNKDYTLKIFPNLNHLFQHCVTGAPTEDLPHEFTQFTFAEDVLPFLGDWLVKHTK